MDKKYDVFISYRREGGAQYARILQLMLAQRGYRVFLDYDELKDGNFSDRIKKAIQEAPVFMMVLSEKSMDRCVNEGDWVRQEITMAIQERKHIVPVNPDNTFNGIPDKTPNEIKDAIGQNQHSDISFGQALGVTVDLMIKDRLVPTLGQRIPVGNIDTEYETAKKTLEKKDVHNKFMKKLGIAGVFIAITIILATCFYITTHQEQLEKEAKEQEALANMCTELERKYNCFSLYLNQGLTMQQMKTIDDILDKMVNIKPDTLWMSQFEFTIGQWYGIKEERFEMSDKDIPMTGKSYGEIQMFIMDLSDITNIEFDLPSAEEWLYAAHGGSYHDSSIYVGSDNVDDVAWFKGNSNGLIHPSNGQQGKDPNILDLFDMSGNVGEFCNTPFVSGIDNASYTVCGGDYTSTAEEVTATSRKRMDTNAKDKTTGFRLIIRKHE